MNKVYEIVTDKIVAELDKGKIPWSAGFIRHTPMNYESKRPYTGVNRLLLALAGFEQPYFLTFNQIKKYKGRIKNGEKSNIVIFIKNYEKEIMGPNGVEIETRFVMRYYRVFNIEQIEGVEFELDENRPVNKIKACEDIINGYKNCPPIIEDLGKDPSYDPAKDEVYMPPRKNFKNEVEFYATLFHELIHSTGHETRLKRLLTTDRTNTEYAREELVAELGSVFLSQDFDLPIRLKNHAGYIQYWSKHLKDDPKLIVRAASKAEQAINYIKKHE